MKDLVIPYVIHWDGEPEPDLSGIEQPVRLRFRLARTSVSDEPPPVLTSATAGESLAELQYATPEFSDRSNPERSATRQNAGKPVAVLLPDGTPAIDPVTGEMLIKPEFVDIIENVKVGRYLRQEETAALFRERKFFGLFQEGGSMDYQRTKVDGSSQFDKRYTAFASCNYGLVAAAAGLPLWFALFAAGTYNRLVHPQRAETWYGNPEDNEKRIATGYEDYFRHFPK